MHLIEFGGRASPDPLGELKASARPPSWIKGSLLIKEESKWKGNERREGGRRNRGMGREGWWGKGGEGKRRTPLLWIIDTPLNLMS